jgi:hypothetical protein
MPDQPKPTAAPESPPAPPPSMAPRAATPPPAPAAPAPPPPARAAAPPAEAEAAPQGTDKPLHERSKLKFAAAKQDKEPMFMVLKPCTSALHAPNTVQPYASFAPNAPFSDDDQGHAKKAAATDSVITRLINLGAIVEHQEPEPPAS